MVKLALAALLISLVTPHTGLAFQASSASFLLDDGAIGTLGDSGASSASFGLRSYTADPGQEPSTSTSFTSKGAALSYDDTAPLVGTINDGPAGDVDWLSTPTASNANWSGFTDPESGITLYEYTLTRSSDSNYWNAGTSSWTASAIWNGNGTSGSLSLSHANLNFMTSDYFQHCVRATNGAGLVSTSVCTDGFGLSPSTEMTLPTTVALGTFVNPGSLDRSATLPITVTTNARSGYDLYVAKTGALSNGAQSITDITDSGCTVSGVVWPGTLGFGFTSDSSVDGNKFLGGTRYCALPTNPTFVKAAARSGPLSGTPSATTHTLTLRAQVNTTQAAGSYQTTLYVRLVPSI